MKATARANSNIALVKYWGKRDAELILPYNSSISMTLEGLHTTTTVEYSEKYQTDSLMMNGVALTKGPELEGVKKFMHLVQEKTNIRLHAKIATENNFPTAAGLASSASGFAALALAATKAAGKELSPKELSMLARRGSGSASRSFQGGFVEWKKGNRDDGLDSFAEQLAAPSHWENLRMIISIVSTKAKKVKSRAGMSQTVATSSLYKGWLDSVDADLSSVRRAIKERNFSLLGSTAEMNALKMHATMITTSPSIIYWQPASIAVMHEVHALREEGLEGYFTMDAGPQVKVLCLESNAKQIEKHIAGIEGVEKTIVCRVGDKAKIINEDLF